ncbi:hypothetical protein [Streptomyces tirandamycinicus]|uniref:hypothetical protein n=1 Tax=Streptomyces tirandamycinicus TaxID=2174846 RepID=UPI00142E7A62|nr:hypothetical protein [Streptomyces tirandamycinicus]
MSHPLHEGEHGRGDGRRRPCGQRVRDVPAQLRPQAVDELAEPATGGVFGRTAVVERVLQRGPTWPGIRAAS